MYNPGKRGSKSSNVDTISLIEASLSAKRQQTSFKRINLTAKATLYNDHYAVFDLTFPNEQMKFVQNDHYYPLRIKNPTSNAIKYTVFTPTEFYTPQRETFQVYCLNTNTNETGNDKTMNRTPTFYIVPTEGYVKCNF